MKLLRNWTGLASLLLFLFLLGTTYSAAEETGEKAAQSASEINLSKLPLDAVETEVLQQIRENKFDLALKTLSREIRHQGRKVNPKLIYLRAFIEQSLQKYKPALKDLISLAKSDKFQVRDRDKVLLHKRTGDCYYANHQFDKAFAEYKEALNMPGCVDGVDLTRQNLDELAMGALVRMQDYAQAKPYAEEFSELAKKRYSGGSYTDIASFFWAQLELIDLCRQLGDTAEAKELTAAQDILIEKIMNLREQLEKNGLLPNLDRLREHLMDVYVAQLQPHSLADYLWASSEYRLRSFPMVRWQPDNGECKAVILCIHGLGLENRAFEWLAHDLTKKGYVVIAIDVRGFGSWQSAPGREEVNFDKCLSDIEGVSRRLHLKYPIAPLFLLGESMGGACALNSASRFGAQFAGVVSSVPSAERYGQNSTAIDVAMHFISNRNKPMDLTDTVADRATAQVGLRKVWENDIKAKLALSPEELLKFDTFMKDTRSRCSDIKNTPVLIVQGLKDRLVKPAGSFEMFDSVGSVDKTLLLIGTAEHLMFETADPSPLLIDTLTSWLNQRISAQSVPSVFNASGEPNSPAAK